jgi:hypothetical protein
MSRVPEPKRLDITCTVCDKQVSQNRNKQIDRRKKQETRNAKRRKQQIAAASLNSVVALLACCLLFALQLSAAALATHVSTPTHLSNLTRRFYALQAENDKHVQILGALQNVLAKAEQTIEKLVKERDAKRPIRKTTEKQGGERLHTAQEQSAHRQSPVLLFCSFV